jgi:uncharacterized membrane protein
MNKTHEGMIWYVAFLTWGVGDIVTTHIGLQEQGIVESNPIAEAIYDAAGTPGMMIVKLLLLLIALEIYRVHPDDYRKGIPIGFALLGIVIVINNVLVLTDGT